LLGTGIPNIASGDWSALRAVLISAFSGGLVAAGKALREKIASGDYNNLVHRLPL